jgi:hypothetical protein
LARLAAIDRSNGGRRGMSSYFAIS